MIYDVAVIGTGPAGYVFALRVKSQGLSVCAIEKDDTLGGVCLNVGCIPSKTYLHYTELKSLIEEQKNLLGIGDGELNFLEMKQRKGQVVESLVAIVRSLLKQNGIDVVRGVASVASPTTIKVIQDGKRVEVSAKNIVIATGSESIALPFLPFDEKVIVSSTGALDFNKAPSSLLVVGAGAIGCELASVYARLKSKVTVVELLPTICPGLDSDLQRGLQSALKKQGIEFFLLTQVTGAKKLEDGVEVTIKGKEELSKKFDAVLVAIGRKPLTHDLGLDKLGVKLTAKGFIQVDANFRTNIENIYAIGDVIEGPMLAHKASEEAMVVADYIAGKTSSIDYMTIPNVIYTNPECATVGLTEEEVKNLGVDYKVGKSFLKGNPRAKATGYEMGFVKVIADKNSDLLLGMHILSPHASELISFGMLALFKKATVKELASLAFPHPTLSEAIKEACMMVA